MLVGAAGSVPVARQPAGPGACAADGVDHVFVVLKGQHRGRPLTADGLDEILSGARSRAGLAHATCHELRHTCFTRLRESGMALEAIQAQAVVCRSRRPGSICS